MPVMGQLCDPCDGAEVVVAPAQENMVVLNVGGHVFKIASKFLANSGSPVFTALLEAGPGPDREYFLDRDGEHYQYVLDFLCGEGKNFLLPRLQSVRFELAHESHFLGLHQLVGLLERRSTSSSRTWPAGLSLQKSLTESPPPSIIDGADGTEYKGAPLPKNEAERISRLEALHILDPGHNDPRFHNATRMVAAIFEAPIALISLVHDTRQLYKSRVGWNALSTDRRLSICAHMFTPENPSMLVVEDCATDPRLMHNPLVKGDSAFRYYAGCPLVTSDGLRLGGFCVIDHVPRKTTPSIAQCLVNFSTIVSQEIERDELTSSSNIPEAPTLAGKKEATTSSASLPEEAAMETVKAPLTPADYAAGAFRRDRMRTALGEAILFVKARSDSLEWPVLFANEGWSRMTSINVLSPANMSSEVIASGPGLACVAEGKTSCKNPMLWDWLEISTQDSQKLTTLIQERLLLNSPLMFHIGATMRKHSHGGGGCEYTNVSCRFLPADMPLDVNAAAIMTVHDENVLSEGSSRRNKETELYYFVTVSFHAGETISKEIRRSRRALRLARGPADPRRPRNGGAPAGRARAAQQPAGQQAAPGAEAGVRAARGPGGPKLREGKAPGRELRTKHFLLYQGRRVLLFGRCV
jgi:GAF domain-containing protein